MRISKNVLKTLKSLGINVRWYPEKTYEEFKKNQWEKEYKHWFEYSKSSCKELNPSGKWVVSWDFGTLAEYEEHIKKFCDRIIDRHCDPYEYDTLFIEHDHGQLLVKKESVKSKVITVEYIQKLVDKDRKLYAGTYGKFAIAMQKLLEDKGLTNKFCVYPTTYGIGVWVIFNYKADEDISKVEEIMKEKGIEYYNEYSEKHWVYRFKVSKREENLARITA